MWLTNSNNWVDSYQQPACWFEKSTGTSCHNEESKETDHESPVMRKFIKDVKTLYDDIIGLNDKSPDVQYV